MEQGLKLHIPVGKEGTISQKSVACGFSTQKKKCRISLYVLNSRTIILARCRNFDLVLFTLHRCRYSLVFFFYSQVNYDCPLQV